MDDKEKQDLERLRDEAAALDVLIEALIQFDLPTRRILLEAAKLFLLHDEAKPRN
mgnify:FL=1